MKKHLELLERSNGLKEHLNDIESDIAYSANGGHSIEKDFEQENLKDNRDSVRLELTEVKKLIKENEDKRTAKEFRRLNKVFKEYESDNFVVVSGLMNRAAFMRVQLENYEQDIIINGSVEPFSQGDQAPYDRARPVVQQYATMNSNYQKIIKQLSDLLPDNDKIDDIKDVIKKLEKPS